MKEIVTFWKGSLGGGSGGVWVVSVRGVWCGCVAGCVGFFVCGDFAEVVGVVWVASPHPVSSGNKHTTSCPTTMLSFGKDRGRRTSPAEI